MATVPLPEVAARRSGCVGLRHANRRAVSLLYSTARFQFPAKEQPVDDLIRLCFGTNSTRVTCLQENAILRSYIWCESPKFLNATK